MSASCLALVLGAIVGFLISPARAGISIEMVTVGDAGNVGELSGDHSPRICGAVNYAYQIAIYEVTNAQYGAFLNSVARYGDPFELYSSSSWGIQRAGTGTLSDPYVYTSRNNDPDWDTKPVNYVSWYSSLRFVNWLQNGQPVTEAGPGVTETGTYTLIDWSPILDYYVVIPDHATLTTPTWVLPTEDEWYKAAYYKAGGTAAGYWDFATQTDKWPDNNPPWLDSGNSVNFENPVTEQYAIGPPYYLNDGGAYALSEGPYGTYDQDGNLAELTETLTYSIYGDPWVRGGYWDLVVLPSYVRYWTSPHDTRNYIGFRVGMVPEPATIGWLAVGWLLLRRRRRAMGRCG